MSDESRMPSEVAPQPDVAPGTLPEPSGGTLNQSPEQAAHSATNSAAGDTTTVPGYEILGELGRGAMGVVYNARHVKLNRPVALKMILGAVDGPTLIRFLAEAEAVASVKHGNVVQVYDYGESGGKPYMALELCSGGPLSARLRDGVALAPRDAAETVAGIAAGVGAAHALSIVHRDLKPGNVLLAGDGTPKVSDFGLAKRATNDLTATQAIMGTPAYMSPEQAKGGTKFVGPQADVWALGVILYECLTGARPFAGRTNDEVLAQVLSSDPPSVRDSRSEVSRDLELIVRTCLEKNPADRYPTARELSDDLGRLVRGEPISVRPLGAAARGVRWARRNPVMAGLFGLVAAVGLGLIGALYGMYEKEKDRANAETDKKEIAQRAADEALRREQAEREAAAEKLRVAAEEEAKKSAEARADELVAMLDGMFRSSDPLSAFFGDAAPLFGAGPGSAGLVEKLGPFLKVAAERFRATLTDPKVALVRAKLLASLGNGMKNLNMFGEAKELLSESLALRRAHLPNPDAHPDVWQSELDLARLQADTGDVQSGLKIIRRVYSIQQAAGADEKILLTTRMYEGIGLMLLGLDEAGPVLNGVLAGRRRLNAVGDRDRVLAILAVVTLHIDSGEWKEIVALYQELNEGVAALSDERVRDLLQPVIKLQLSLSQALISDKAGAVGRALMPGQLRDVRTELAALEKRLGPNYPILMIFRYTVARLLVKIGETKEADAEYTRVLNDLRKTVGVAHPKALDFLDHYVNHLIGSKRKDEAVRLFTEFEEANIKRFGPNNPWLPEIRLERARFEAEHGNADEAARRAADILKFIRDGSFLNPRKRVGDVVAIAYKLNEVPAHRQLAIDLADAILPHTRDPEFRKVIAGWTIGVLVIVGLEQFKKPGGASPALATYNRARALLPLVPDFDPGLKTTILSFCAMLELYRGGLDQVEACCREIMAVNHSPRTAKDRVDDLRQLMIAVTARGDHAQSHRLLEGQRVALSEAKDGDGAEGWCECEAIGAINLYVAGRRAEYRTAIGRLKVRYGETKSRLALLRFALVVGLDAPHDGWKVDDLATVISAVKTTPNDHLALGLLYLRAGKLAEAGAFLGREGLETSPGAAAVRGLLAVARNDAPAARALLAQAESLLTGQVPTQKEPFALALRDWASHFARAALMDELRSELGIAPPPRPR